MASLISLGQVIDKTLVHYKKHFVELLSITAWMVVASVPAALAKLLQPFTAGTALTPLHLLTIALNDLGAVLLGVVSAWALLTVIIAIQEEASGAAADVKARARRSWKLFLPYVWVSILLALVFAAILLPPVLGFILLAIDFARNTSTMLTTIGFVLFIFGSIVSFILLVKYSIQFGFAPYSLVLDGERGMKALTHSSDLVKGRWWATFFRFVLPKLLYSLVIVVVNVVLFAALAILLVILIGDGQLFEGIGNATWLLLGSAISALTVPLIAVTDYYIYDSLRSARS
jgi:hypothetical protein